MSHFLHLPLVFMQYPYREVVSMLYSEAIFPSYSWNCCDMLFRISIIGSSLPVFFAFLVHESEAGSWIDSDNPSRMRSWAGPIDCLIPLDITGQWREISEKNCTVALDGVDSTAKRSYEDEHNRKWADRHKLVLAC